MTARARSVAQLTTLLPSRGIVAIDGLTGSGKSRLARELGRRTSRNVISLDDFIRYGPAPYPEMLDLQRLSLLLTEAPTSIVEGILLLDVLGRIHVQPAMHVYVRRWDHPGQLHSPEYWEMTPRELTEHEEDLCTLIGAGRDEPVIGRELAYYHEEFQPYEIADLVYENLVL
jgi:hypothetical protein